jgi:hypothetical protein
MVATLIHGFFFATPSYSGRVQHTSNTGLELQHVTLADSGVFIVEVIVQSASGNLVRLQRSVTVTVAGEFLGLYHSVYHCARITSQFEI